MSTCTSVSVKCSFSNAQVGWPVQEDNMKADGPSTIPVESKADVVMVGHSWVMRAGFGQHKADTGTARACPVGSQGRIESLGACSIETPSLSTAAALPDPQPLLFALSCSGHSATCRWVRASAAPG